MIFFSYHWNDLCQETSSVKSEIIKSDSLDIGQFKNVSFLIGTQSIPKFGKIQDITSVKIRLLCLRIPEISSDILISSSSQFDSEAFSENIFMEICESFCIHNWTLFK
jgi:hypothetical protein